MKQILTFFAIFLALSLTAQTTQKGVVKEYNEKAQKTPLTGVELNVRSANSTVSDKEGNFILEFLSLKPGEKVNVRRIEKLGYEVFNKEAIEQWNLNPKTPFVIVMCRSDRFKKIRDNYEKVSSESYARQLKKEESSLLKLKEQGKIKEAEYQRQLFELREYYENQLDNLENYIDRFSRIDLSELTAEEQEIITLVQQGQIDEAIAQYEDQNYIDKYFKEIEDIKEISSAIDQLSEVKQSKIESRNSLLAAVERHIETLKLAGGRENFDKIGNILKNIAEFDSLDYNNVYKYGKYLEDQNLHIKAINVLNKAYRLCDDVEQKALISIEYSWALMGNSQFEEATKIIDCSLLNCDNFDAELTAKLLHVKASALFKQAKFSDAKRELQNAMNVLNGYDLPSVLGPIYYTMSSLSRTTKDFDSAINYINKALETFRNISQISVSKFSDNIIKCMSGLANSYFYSGNLSSAINTFIDLDTGYSDLYRNNPNRYAKDYAWNQYMIAKCYIKYEDIENAQIWLNKSLSIIEPLYQDSHLSCGKEYVQILENLGLCQVSLKNIEMANMFYEKSTQVASSLYETVGDPVKPMYLGNLYNNAFRFHQSGQYKRAIDNNLLALRLCESLYQSDMRSYGEIYTSIMMHLSEAYRHIEDLKMAKDFAERALSLRINELNNMGIIRNEHIAEAYRICGSIFNDLDQYDAALGAYDKAYSFYLKAVPNNKKYKKYCVAMKRNAAAIYSEVMDDHSKAIIELNAALEFEDDDVSVLEQLGMEYSLNKDQKACVSIYQKILSIDPEYPKQNSDFFLTVKEYL